MEQNKQSNGLIFRKQSLWLLMAAVLASGVFFFDLFRADGIVPLRVSDSLPSLIIALVMVVLPFVTIFMFGNRKRQVRMTAMCMLTCISFISTTLFRVTRLNENGVPPLNGSYWIGAILPFAVMVFIIMAMLAIRKDTKLVRSMDRLR